MARAVVYMRQHWSRDLKEAGKRATRVSPEAANRPWGGSVNPESGACQVTARGGRDASVRHPTRCHSQHGQLSGAQGCKGTHDKARSALRREADASRWNRGRGCGAHGRALHSAAWGGGGGAGSRGRPWAGRAMPWGSSRKGALCCHTSPTAEGAQGGPGVGEGPAWVPGRSPFQNLDMGTLRLSPEPVQPLGGAGTSPRASISSTGLCDFPMSPQLPRRESTSPCAQRRSRGREEDGSWHLHPQRGCPHRAALGKYWLRRIDQQNHTPKGFPCWTSSRSKPNTLLPGPSASALIPNTEHPQTVTSCERGSPFTGRPARILFSTGLALGEAWTTRHFVPDASSPTPRPVTAEERHPP